MHGGLQHKTLQAGMKMIFMNDAHAKKGSTAISIPSGYFREAHLNKPIGVASLLANSILNFEKESSHRFVHRTASVSALDTTYSICSSHKEVELETSAYVLWMSLTDFNEARVDKILIREESFKLQQALESDQTTKPLLQKYLISMPNHPYHRASVGSLSSLDNKETPKNTKFFYDEAYIKRNITAVILTNLKDNLTTSDGKKKHEIERGRLSQIFTAHKNDIHSPHPLEKLEVGLPFENLPKLLCIEAEEKDTIELTYQIKTTTAEQASFESIKFASFLLEEILRPHIAKSKLAYNVTSTAEYFTDFALLRLSAQYTRRGKERTGEILGMFIRAVDEIKTQTNLKLYSEVAKDLRIIFNTKNFPTERKFAQFFASRVNKFGFTDSMRATETLNYYSQYEMDTLFAQLNWKNLFVTISGDFFYENSVNKADRAFKRVNLNEALNKRIFQNFVFDPLLNKVPARRGSITLDQYLPLYDKLYHLQTFNGQEIQEIERLAKESQIYFKKENKFNLGEKFIEDCKKRANKTGSLGKEGKVERGVLKNLATKFKHYYRENNGYTIPQAFLALRFMFRSEKNHLIPSRQRYHVWSLILEYVWRRRLSFTTGQYRDFNGRIEVKFEHNSLVVRIWGPAGPQGYFAKVVKEVSDKISLNHFSLSEDEVDNAQEEVFRRLKKSDITWKKSEQNFIDLIVDDQFFNRNLAIYLLNDLEVFKGFSSNPELVQSFYEGSHSESEARDMLNDFRREFGVKEGGYTHPGLVKMDNSETLLVYRMRRTEKEDSTVDYITGINLGEANTEVTAIGHMLARYFLFEMREEFQVVSSLALKVDVKALRVAQHIVLRFLVVGERLDFIEVAVEDFLKRGYEKLMTINKDKLQSLCKLSTLDYEKEYDFLEEMAKEEEEDLFLNFRDHKNSRMRAKINSEWWHIDKETFASNVEEMLKKPKRIVFEYVKEFVEKTALNKENTFRNVEVDVRAILD